MPKRKIKRRNGLDGSIPKRRLKMEDKVDASPESFKSSIVSKQTFFFNLKWLLRYIYSFLKSPMNMCPKLCLLAISFRKVHNYSQSRWEDQSLAGFFIKALHTNRDKEPHNLLKPCLRPKAVNL